MSIEHNPKTIVLFTPGPVGGAEKVIVNGQKALISQRPAIELWIIKEERVPGVIQKFEELVNEAKITSRYFSCRNVFDFDLLRILKRKLRKARPKILHAHGFKAALYAWLAKPRGCKLIITHHGRTGHTLKVKVYEWIESRILKKADAVIAVSGSMKSELSLTGIHHKKLFLVENLLTLNLKTRIESKAGNLRLLYIGRLSPEKGCHVLLEALKVSNENIELVVIGDGVERKRLIDLRNTFNLGSNVLFAGFQKDVAAYLQKADALVMPSFTEGQPLALIEACCMGIPVIASRVGGIPELIQDGENGYLFEAGNAADLAKQIQKLIRNMTELTEATKVRQQSMQTRFAPETWAQTTLATYDQVLIKS